MFDIGQIYLQLLTLILGVEIPWLIDLKVFPNAVAGHLPKTKLVIISNFITLAPLSLLSNLSKHIKLTVNSQELKMRGLECRFFYYRKTP